MKKAYQKPKIVFESFMLSTSIAGDCEVKTYLPSNNTCGLNFTGFGNVFMPDMAGCNNSDMVTSQGDDAYLQISFDPNDTICYHVPFGNNLFNS